MSEALSTWASKVHVKPIKKQRTIRLLEQPTGDSIDSIADWVESKKKSADEEAVIRSSKDISRTSIAARTQDRKDKARLEKKIKRIELGPKEILCMVDSGSFVHAINAEVELPHHQLTPPTEQDKQLIAEAACGGKLTKQGSVHVACETDGSKVAIEFDSMRVKTPILSVRQLVRDDNEVRFRRHKGFIPNLVSGEINVFEYQGVYVMKLKIQQPNDQNNSKQDVHRQGA